MKTNDKNSMSESQSLLKAVDKSTDADREFLKRLGELSAQEFERAADAGDMCQSGIESKWRHIIKNRITQLSSAAAILIAALVGLYTLLGPGVTVTFAKAVEPILNATTLSYDFFVGSEEDGVLMHDIVAKSRIRRTIGDTTMIIDMDNEKMLTLDDTDKTAVYLDFKGPLKKGTQIFTQFIRETIAESRSNGKFNAENLGKKEIDGIEVIGFRTGKIGKGIIIWANAKTAIPVQIDMFMEHQDFIIKNLEFNIPVDASLIDMDVPDGYALEQANIDLSSATEQDFIAGLKVWIEIVLDGQFPAAITSKAYMKDIPLMEKKLEALDMPEEDAANLGIQYIKGMMFINLFPVQGNSDLHYVGKGAAYGDSETPVFWYRPAGSENYRVIYADLSVKEVAPDELPK